MQELKNKKLQNAGTRKCRNQKLKNNCRNSCVQKLQKLNKNRMQKLKNRMMQN
jgi:hypothetical protein